MSAKCKTPSCRTQLLLIARHKERTLVPVGISLMILTRSTWMLTSPTLSGAEILQGLLGNSVYQYRWPNSWRKQLLDWLCSSYTLLYEKLCSTDAQLVFTCYGFNQTLSQSESKTNYWKAFEWGSLWAELWVNKGICKGDNVMLS